MPYCFPLLHPNSAPHSQFLRNKPGKLEQHVVGIVILDDVLENSRAIFQNHLEHMSTVALTVITITGELHPINLVKRTQPFLSPYQLSFHAIKNRTGEHWQLLSTSRTSGFCNEDRKIKKDKADDEYHPLLKGEQMTWVSPNIDEPCDQKNTEK